MEHGAGHKFFLVGMVVAATLSTPAWAWETGRSDAAEAGRPRNASVDVIQEAPEMRIEGKSLFPSRLFDHLSSLLDRLTPDTNQADAQGNDWQLKLAQPESPKLGASGDPKASSAKPVGLSLHLKF